MTGDDLVEREPSGAVSFRGSRHSDDESDGTHFNLHCGTQTMSVCRSAALASSASRVLMPFGFGAIYAAARIATKSCTAAACLCIPTALDWWANFAAAWLCACASTALARPNFAATFRAARRLAAFRCAVTRTRRSVWRCAPVANQAPVKASLHGARCRETASWRFTTACACRIERELTVVAVAHALRRVQR